MLGNMIVHKASRGCFLRSLFLAFLIPAAVHANSEMRDWKLADGTSVTGEIVSVDEENGSFVLRDNRGKESSIPMDSLANLDRAWLTEWIEMNEELAAKVKELGGRLQRFEGKGKKYTTGFFVYEPSARVKSGEAGPAMMLFCPSGKPMRYLLRHVEAAEATGMTLISAEYFRNRIPNEEYQGRFEDLHPLITEAVKHDPAKFFVGGTSGGAMGAFRLTARFPEIRIAGVYSNGGWLGPASEARLPYQKMRVALVNGDKDNGANHYNEFTTKVLQERECTVGMFAFEGGHQIPPTSVQTKSFRWLLGEFN